MLRGHSVNIAARLCENAEPDEILMTDRVVDQLEDPPPVEEHPPRALVGVPARVALYGLSA